MPETIRTLLYVVGVLMYGGAMVAVLSCVGVLLVDAATKERP